MYTVFIRLLNMGLAAGVIALVNVLLRPILRKLPAEYRCILWALVALRLLCPFGISSSLSVWNLLPAETDSAGQIEYFRYGGGSEKPELLFDVPGLVNDSTSPDSVTFGAHTSDLYLPSVMGIWLFGTAVLLGGALLSYLRLRREVSAAVLRKDNIYICDEISFPFVLGIVRPRIYLPSGMAEETERNVIAHETEHLKRHDHIWKPLGYVLLSVYWFNPILWLAYILFCRDIESACDENVIAKMDRDGIASYSEALLACAVGRRIVSACPVAFGETDVKGRVKNILRYRKPAFWVICAAAVLCVVLAVCFLTGPRFQPYSFVSDGEFCTIEVIGGSELLVSRLPVDMENGYRFLVLGGEELLPCDRSEVYTAGGDFLQAHFTAERAGTGTILLEYMDTSGGERVLYLSFEITQRHGGLQIETVSVTPEEDMDAPPISIMHGTIVEIRNGSMLVTPVEGSWERNSSDLFSIPVQNMVSSPEPQVGDMIEVAYCSGIEETYPAMLGDIQYIMALPAEESEAVAWEDRPAVCIDGVTYLDTGRAVPVEPDESAIEYVEIPAGASGVSITAFAVLEEGEQIVCLVNGEWYEFTAES